MTHILQQPDYSDYVRNVRESAAVLDRIARNNVVKRDELLGVASFLHATAMSLEDAQDAEAFDEASHVVIEGGFDSLIQPDPDNSILEGLITWKSLPQGDSAP